jgi:hypothetical protein
MLMIRTLRRVSGILPLTRWLTDTSATAILVVVHLAVALVLIQNTVHGVIAFTVPELIIHTKTGAAACTTALALVVSCQGIPTRKSSATFRAGVRPLTSVQFRMAFEIV